MINNGLEGSSNFDIHLRWQARGQCKQSQPISSGLEAESRNGWIEDQIKVSEKTCMLYS